LQLVVCVDDEAVGNAVPTWEAFLVAAVVRELLRGRRIPSGYALAHALPDGTIRPHSETRLSEPALAVAGAPAARALRSRNARASYLPARVRETSGLRADGLAVCAPACGPQQDPG
jgi:hypothetical protein